MKVKLLCVFLFFTSIVFSQNSDKEKEKLNKIYIKFLEEEGYRPSIDEDGDVFFKIEGNTYYIKARYPDFFQMSRFLNVEDEGCSDRLRVMLNSFHFNRIDAKAMINRSCKQIEVRVSSILAKPSDWEIIFEESRKSLKFAVKEFWEMYGEMRETKKKSF